MLKASQKRTKRAAFTRGVDVEAAREDGGLVGHDAHAPPAEAREAHHDVGRVVRVHLEEAALVHHRLDEVLDVVGLAGLGGDERVEGRVLPVRRVVGLARRAAPRGCSAGR